MQPADDLSTTRRGAVTIVAPRDGVEPLWHPRLVSTRVRSKSVSILCKARKQLQDIPSYLHTQPKQRSRSQTESIHALHQSAWILLMRRGAQTHAQVMTQREP